MVCRRGLRRALWLVVLLPVVPSQAAEQRSYVVVDTGQDGCYNEAGRRTACPEVGRPLTGQDAQHQGTQPRYVDNRDGTVSDLNTGLMWIKAPFIGLSFDAAISKARILRIGGHSDWRLPTVKELYSLIDFRGFTGRSASSSKPYIDTSYFEFSYGDERAGDRFIDAQYVSRTEYVSTTMGGNATVFGVNFADGRIKGYPKTHRRRGPKLFHVRYVRGNPGYGTNDLRDNGDGTISDGATGLMWAKADSGQAMAWGDALAWVQQRNGESYLGYRDWRLPNAKELQSIVDYGRSPDTSRSASIDPVFDVTQISNEGGEGDYPFFWTSTTHLEGRSGAPGRAAVYVAFGRALGFFSPGQRQHGPGRGPRAGPPSTRGSNTRLGKPIDVHGAGAQRSDPKAGDPARYSSGRGPQGDVVRIQNFVRCVRGGSG